jgi:hypothetical protein
MTAEKDEVVAQDNLRVQHSPLGSTCPIRELQTAIRVRADFAGGVRNSVNGTPTISIRWTAGTTDHFISLLDAKPQNEH